MTKIQFLIWLKNFNLINQINYLIWCKELFDVSIGLLLRAERDCFKVYNYLKFGSLSHHMLFMPNSIYMLLTGLYTQESRLVTPNELLIYSLHTYNLAVWTISKFEEFCEISYHGWPSSFQW